ncbi:methyltransferase domain-containing protein [Pseudorhodoferax sp.]|uniref:methyltransferase domain-containing protein n=1 Tax=Pseudorhodoferax sp. TaxID=1993553 RepID=UPI0039E4A4C5
MAHQVRDLEFTGERYIPGVHGDIEIEHLHRYLQACKIAAGKHVLDIASGEGYGSAMLARDAAYVTGVDIAPDAVRHAQEKYGNERLEFRVGDCAAIPLSDACVDVVVSFETIEHHSQHEEMLREIKRVLRPDGVLIISSPDKLEYSDKPGYVNEFHVKELYRSEFQQLLARHFSHHRLYGQRVAYGSVVLSEGDDGPQQTESYAMDDFQPRAYAGVPYAVYLIAVASDGSVPTLGTGIFDLPLSSAPAVKDCQEHAARLQDAVDELRTALDAVVTERDACKRAIRDLEDAVRSRSEERDAAKSRISELSGLQAGVDELRTTVGALIVERDAYKRAIGNLEEALRLRSAERDAAESRANELSGLQAGVDELRTTVEAVMAERDAYRQAVETVHEIVQRRSAEHESTMVRLRDEYTQDIGCMRQQLEVAQRETVRCGILIGEHVSRIHELEARAADLARQSHELKETREVLASDNEQQRAVADALREQLAQTYQSRSWRITAPLRKATSILLRRRWPTASAEYGITPAVVRAADSASTSVVSGSDCRVPTPTGSTAVPYRILLVSYYCPTRAHAGGLRILDIYALLKRMCPEVQLDLFTHHRPEIDWSMSEVYSIFNNVYLCAQEDLSPRAFAAFVQGGATAYDVVDLQFHQSAHHLSAYRTIGRRILFTPMESQAKALYLEMHEQIRRNGKVGLRKLAALFKLAFEEISFCRKADAVVCVSKTDAAFIRAVGGGRHVRGIETGLSPFEFSNALADNFVPPRSKDRSRSVIYVAYFGSDTNIKALEWFLQNVHPDIVKAVPGYKLVVVGRGDLSAFHSYAGSSVELVGEVPVLEPYIRNANHGIAPALGGSGFRGKINQYAVLGVPAVATRIALKGLAYRDGQSILAADSPSDFSRCCIRLLLDDELNDEIAAQARRICIQTYGWQSKWASIATTYRVKEYAK